MTLLLLLLITVAEHSSKHDFGLMSKDDSIYRANVKQQHATQQRALTKSSQPRETTASIFVLGLFICCLLFVYLLFVGCLLFVVCCLFVCLFVCLLLLLFIVIVIIVQAVWQDVADSPCCTCALKQGSLCFRPCWLSDGCSQCLFNF